MLEHLEVDYEVHTTTYTIAKALDKLSDNPIMSLDFETQSIYSLDERAEAKELVKKYHPDFIQSKDLDESFVDFAKQKMQEINHAYDRIKRERGI